MSTQAPAHVVRVYWQRVFTGTGVIASVPGLSVAVNPALDRARQVMVLTLPDGAVRVVMTPAWAAAIGGMPEPGPADPLAWLRARLADAGATLHAPDLLFYPAACRALSAPPPAIRRLSRSDDAAFTAFEGEATAQDRDDAGVELAHWAVFGSVADGRLASVASAFRWDAAAIADLGVLTLAAERGRGHARAVVLALMHFARAAGYEPQYRCQRNNAASIALAGACGLVPFGRWEVIALDRDDPGAAPPP